MLERTSQNKAPRIIQTTRPIGPFDFALSLRFMSGGDPHIARYGGGQYWQVLRVGETLVHAAVRSTGLVTSPQLHVTFHSERPLADREISAAMRYLSFILNVNFDLKPFYRAAKHDVLMTELINRLYGLKNIMTATVFEALVCSIIEQQISLPVAHALERNVIKTFGDSMELSGIRYYAFPTARQLTRASADALRRCGISRQKAEYLTEIAKMIDDGGIDIEWLKKCDDTPTILDVLRSLRGVGPWTAELTALRGINRLDVLPAAAAGLERRWIAHYYCNDQAVTPHHVRKVAARWGEWKGLAGYYVITAGRLGIGV